MFWRECSPQSAVLLQLNPRAAHQETAEQPVDGLTIINNTLNCNYMCNYNVCKGHELLTFSNLPLLMKSQVSLI